MLYASSPSLVGTDSRFIFPSVELAPNTFLNFALIALSLDEIVLLRVYEFSTLVVPTPLTPPKKSAALVGEPMYVDAL